ncbi:hypothetical protein T02_8063 [Trichinella nativa]|uniref:Uncharacterized protein n=1 Tax=Trichinella nativa TaxID=6335 RepID=A0A0V1LBB1_9BILA|nr:hypothetical protein T02_8063 [Trichinella nativa]
MFPAKNTYISRLFPHMKRGMEEGGIGYYLKVLSFTLFDHFIKQHYHRWARMNLFEHGFIGIKWLVINPLNSGSAIISNRSYMQVMLFV